MQQNLQISSQLTKGIMEIIKKGDIEQLKAEQAKMGINVAFLVDDGYKHNAIFYAAQIKDDQISTRMVEWLIEQGVDPLFPDSLNQTALFYACRDGKTALVDLLIKHGCKSNHSDTYG